MPPIPPISCTSYVAPIASAAYNVGYEAVASPFKLGAALMEGGAATSASTLPAGSSWLAQVYNWVRNLSFNGNTAIRSTNVISRFWAGVGNLNFSGTHIGAALKGLGGTGGVILALAGVAGAGILAVSVKNAIVDYMNYNDASHGRTLEVIQNPLFHIGKIGSDLAMAGGGLMILGGGFAPGFALVGLGAAGLVATKIMSWFRSPNNMFNADNVPAPFSHMYNMVRSGSYNHPVWGHHSNA